MSLRSVNERSEAPGGIIMNNLLHNATNRSEGDVWSATHHFDVGIWVRNKLRQRFTWDDITLDQAWSELIEEAARRYVEGRVSSWTAKRTNA
jgi:hypothetical protein